MSLAAARVRQRRDVLIGLLALMTVQILTGAWVLAPGWAWPAWVSPSSEPTSSPPLWC